MSESQRGCVHVNYVTSQENRNHDLCLVKEIIIDNNGKITRGIRPIINAKRDWYLTLPQHRNHKSKKEYEDIRKVKKITCNQASIINSVAKELKKDPKKVRNMARAANTSPARFLNRSQYVYGTDVRIESIIKNHYDKKCPDVKITPTLAVMDYEWRISNKELTVGALVFEEKCHLTINKDILKHIDNPKPKLQHLFETTLLPYIDDYYKKANLKTLKKVLNEHYADTEKQIGELPDGQPIHTMVYGGNIESFYNKHEDIKTFILNHTVNGSPTTFEQRRDYKLHVDIVDHALDVTRKLFDYTHDYQPDYLTFWNGESDFTTISQNCERYNTDLSTFTTDPLIRNNPKLKPFYHSRFIPGQASKLDTNGAEKKIDIQDRWHRFDNLASWQFCDLMAIYAANRAHLPNKPYYTLDYTLDTELGLGKFKFTDTIEELSKLPSDKWHDVMTEKYPLEYCIYAIFDVIGPQLLEDQTADIRGQFYPKLGVSPIQNFKKNPRRLCDKSHFDFLSQGQIIGSTSDQMAEDIDDLLYSTDNWIITLDSGLHDGLGSYCLTDLPEVFTTFIPKVIDADITSSYPSTGRFLNTEKSTTVTELINIPGLTEQKRREIGMNIAAGKGVAIQYCTELLNLPHLNEWNEMYQRDKNITHGE